MLDSCSATLGEEDTTKSFLREAQPIVSAMLVKMILKGEFIDMAELLNDEKRHSLVK